MVYHFAPNSLIATAKEIIMLPVDFKISNKVLNSKIKKLKNKIAYQSRSIDLLNELAGVYFEIKDYKNAIKYYEKCLEINRNAITLSNLGLAHQLSLNFQKSADLFLESIELDPYYFAGYINFGNLLGSMGKHTDLLRCSLNGLEKWPRSTELHSNVGVALMGLGLHKEARTSFETALLIDETSIDALFNIACIEAFERNDQKAVEIYEALLDNSHLLNQSRLVQTKSALSYLYLRSGKVALGWKYYDYGFDPLIPMSIKRNPNRTFAVPKWEGEKLKDQTLLVWREQGIGDEILFASVLPDLINDVEKIILECEPRLIDIFQRSFPTIKVRAAEFDNSNQNFQIYSDFDFHIPIVSLNKIYRNKLEDFKKSNQPYFKSSPFKNDLFRSRMSAFDQKLKIGITWRSGLLDPLRNLEYTNILDWREIFTLPNVEFFNLQYGDCEQELLSAEKEFQIKINRWSDIDLKNDLDDVLSIIQNLDIVIGPCTAVIWMSAALGKTTLVYQYKDWINLGENYVPFNLNARSFFVEPNKPMALALKQINEYLLEGYTNAIEN